MSGRSKQQAKLHVLTPAEKRAAKSERIVIQEAEPYGWIARSESGEEQGYHLYCEPETRRLVCTCADFIFRGSADNSIECKHIGAALKFIARRYLAEQYDPRQQARVA